jgi:hypothetical protein
MGPLKILFVIGVNWKTGFSMGCLWAKVNGEILSKVWEINMCVFKNENKNVGEKDGKQED